MDCIAVVDDRAPQRGTVVRYINRELRRLKVDWQVIDIPPFPSISDYAPWVLENDVRVLVLDEKLSEVINSELSVDYSGHEVAAQLRRQLPDLPQVIITAVPDSEDLDDAEKLDAIVGRQEFLDHAATHVERMVRMGASFFDRHEAELGEMSRLSEKAVLEGLTADERARLTALRQKTQSVAAALESEELSGWLEESKRVQSSLESLLAELRGAQR